MQLRGSHPRLFRGNLPFTCKALDISSLTLVGWGVSGLPAAWQVVNKCAQARTIVHFSPLVCPAFQSPCREAILLSLLVLGWPLSLMEWLLGVCGGKLVSWKFYLKVLSLGPPIPLYPFIYSILQFPISMPSLWGTRPFSACDLAVREMAILAQLLRDFRCLDNSGILLQIT